ncbi:uncharacterized protein BDV14DRAFT_200502 [Aspergillus stella-maris]|uniref:uncharacterized protein n=1 Tax=Aspergillus stella-maris TaxID=1810926 RepID=UPI003CCDF6B7
MHNRDAVLQRITQLDQENGDEIYRYNLHSDIQMKSSPLDTEEIRRQDLRRLRFKLRELQATLKDDWHDTDAPRDAATWLCKNWWLGIAPSRKEDERHRGHRADSGGCCGRMLWMLREAAS